jgi:YD repeat-containing protein
VNLLDGWIGSSQTQSCPPRRTIQPSRATTPPTTTDDSGLGPGTVDPVTGQFALHATDVDIPGVPSVSRSYLSRLPSGGAEGPLGPQWTLSVGVGQTLKVLADQNVELRGAGGESTTFAKSGENEFKAPKGDENLRLTFVPEELEPDYRVKGITEGREEVVLGPSYVLSDPDAGTDTRFIREGSSNVWVPSLTESSAEGNGAAYSYRAVGSVIEPEEVLGPVPAGVSCGANPAYVRLEELKPGCRALTFTYATTKTAKGEAASQWGEFEGRLSKISFTAYNPSAKGMETKVVAEYAYDGKGRLRAEWDPRIESSPACGKTCEALKTTYGYDAAGHVTAMTRPRQQPWAFTYGTIPSDASAGRVLKVTRAQPKATESEEEIRTKLREQAEEPTLAKAPQLSGSPIATLTLGVSKGEWGHNPVVGAYQWERCSASGTECAAIEGATNPNYKLTAQDVGHTVRALVTAINGDAAITVEGAASGAVTEEPQSELEQQLAHKEVSEGTHYAPEPGATVEYKVPIAGEGAPHQMTSAEMAKWGQEKDVPAEATALFPPDEPQGWPASDYTRATVDYMDAQARTVNSATPSGGISTVEYNYYDEVNRRLSAADRALALEKGCESESSCKSAEVAETLSSKNVYSLDGTKLLETYGPEHEVRLANGTEEENRNREKFSYNENAPSEEAHNLVTKIVSWGQTTRQKLANQETTLSYAGQAGLGWKLRLPTLVTSTIEGHTTTKITAYEKETGNRLTNSSSLTAAAPAFAFQVGAAGSGNAQFKTPAGVAATPNGDVLVTDAGNNRVEVLSRAGQFVTSYGTAGSGGTAGSAPQLEDPAGVAVNQSTGNIYVADSGNDRVQELSSEGKLVAMFGFGVADSKPQFEKCASGCHSGLAANGAGGFNDPVGVAVDPSGAIWVVDRSNNRVEKFSTENNYIAEYGGAQGIKLAEPTYIAVSDGNLYIADSGEHRIEEMTQAGAYVGQFGESGTGNGQFANPDGIAANPNTGTLFVGDPGNSRVEEFSRTGTYISQFGTAGSGAGQVKEPVGVTVDALGQIFVVDSGNARVEAWESVPQAPVYTTQFGSAGSEAGQLEEPRGDAVDAHGDVWVAEYKSDRISEFSAAGVFMKTVGWGVSSGAKEWQSCPSKCKKGLAGAGEGEFSGPTSITVANSVVYITDYLNNRVEELSEAEGKYLGQFGTKGSGAEQLNGPTSVAIDPSGDIWVAEYVNHRIDEFSAAGKFLKAIGFDVNKEGAATLETCTKECKAGTSGSGEGQISWVKRMAFSGPNLYVAEYTNSRVQEFVKGEAAEVKEIGGKGTGSGEFEKATGIAVNAAGDLYVADSGDDRIEEFTPSGSYMTQFSDKGAGSGQLVEPEGIAINTAGDLYIVDEGNSRLEEWAPEPNVGNEGARETVTVYYTQATNSEHPNCGGHPEWATLVCESEPAAQPGDPGPPPLPIETTTYNMWDEPETITEKIGTITRTTKKHYDGVGRELEAEQAATVGEGKADKEATAVAPVSEEYGLETGALTKQTETLEGKARATTSIYNTLGQLTSYTDAMGGTTKYAYDVDGRAVEVTEPKGKQTYSYDGMTGGLTKLQDSAAGTFTAKYGVAGELLTVGYPNGMTATYTYNPTGQATKLEYEKTTNCKEKCVWFSDTDAFSVKGELAYQASTLSTETYSYNEAGQVAQTQGTEVGGKGCVTRVYGYGEESGERTSLTTREPNEKGECTSEGGVVEAHFYDVAGRLVDPGVTYEGLGNITRTPAPDAGGDAITSSFYVDNQVAAQEQDEKSVAYSYDPAGRTMTAKMTTKAAATTSVSHYAGPGNALTWTCEEAGECKEAKETAWTREIPGIDGVVAAVQTNGGTPVLQLHDLQGDVIATASLSEMATGLQTTHNVTEFGTPHGGTAPKYSWLGATGASSELETGVITTAGSTYVPQLARTLQTEQPIPPGAAPYGTKVTEAYCPAELSWANEGGKRAAENTVAEQRALEREAAEALGPEIDPEDVVTGHEAEEFAKILEQAANNMNADLENGVGETPGNDGKKDEDPEATAAGANSGGGAEAVVGLAEIGVTEDRAAAKELMACGVAARRGANPNHGEHLSGICYYDYHYRDAFGNLAITRPMTVEACFSQITSVGGYIFVIPNMWTCAGEGTWTYSYSESKFERAP